MNGEDGILLAALPANLCIQNGIVEIEVDMAERSTDSLASLIAACKNGDRKAWSAVIDLVSPLIFSICRKLKLSREESFDIYGQVCYLLLQNIDKLRSASKLPAYVGTMTRREIYAHYRRSRIFDYPGELFAGWSAGTNEETPEKQLEETERRQTLMEAMLELPPRDYHLLRMLFFEQSEPDYEEVSRALDIPVASIGPTRARSLAKLQKILAEKRLVRSVFEKVKKHSSI
jgi:RNA polymerase sigma factor (sigma-70 family)